MPKKNPKARSAHKRDNAPVRRAVIRVFMKAFTVATQQFFIELEKLVLPDQKLPGDDEMLQYTNVRTTIVSGNNPTGVVIQYGIVGPFAEDTSGFLPVSKPQIFSRSGKLFTHLSIPTISRQKKGVLSDINNGIIMKVTAVQGQVDTSAFVCNFTSGFKVPILEYHHEDVGTPHQYESQKVVSEGTPPATADAPEYIIDEYSSPGPYALYTVQSQTDTSIVYVHDGEVGNSHLTVTNLPTGYTKNGLMKRTGSNVQTDYTNQGYAGTIQQTFGHKKDPNMILSAMERLYQAAQNGDIECGVLTDKNCENAGFELVRSLGSYNRRPKEDTNHFPNA